MTSAQPVDAVRQRIIRRTESPRFKLQPAAILLLVVMTVCQSMPQTFLAAQDGKPGSRSKPDKSQPAAELSGPPKNANAGATAKYRIIVQTRRTIRARLQVEAEVKELAPKEWFLYAAQPPELASQTNISCKLSPGGKPVRELSPQKRTMLMTRLKASSESSRRIAVDVEYNMTLVSRLLRARGEKDPPNEPVELSKADRVFCLAKSPLCTFADREFQTWLDDADFRKKSDEDPVDFARRVFLQLRNDFEYVYLSKLDRRATYVCREKKSDCMGLSVLFVSIMRANLVPARILVGRWAESAIPGDTLGGVDYHKEHVKCEFFAEGVGWVPVDLATSVLHDHTSRGLRYFGFGHSDFVTLHVDDTLVFDPGPVGRRTIPFTQNVAVWVIGQGKAGDVVTRQTWAVETIQE